MLVLAVLPALVLLAAPAPQASPPEGLTLDGKSLVYSLQSYRPDDEPNDIGAPCFADTTHVRDLATGEERTFLRSKALCAPSLKAMGKPAALEAFLKAHPLSTLTGLKGPKGSEVIARHAENASLSCSEGVCGVYGDDGAAPDLPAGLDLAVKRADGRVFLLGHVPSATGVGAQYMEAGVHAYWLPDEQAVAVVAGRFDGNVMQSALIVAWGASRFEPVRVSVLGHVLPTNGKASKATHTDADIAEGVANTLRKLGGYSISAGPTKDARTDTVVYAGKGFEADARKVAALIPGSKIDVLSWKADADIVVAVSK